MNRTIYVDIDGTICTSCSLRNKNPEEYKDIQSDYENAKPHRERIDYINSLYEKGNNIIYWPARGVKSRIGFEEFTKNELNEWDAKYHDLDFGDEPHFDMYICDKSYNSESFFQRTLNELP